MRKRRMRRIWLTLCLLISATAALAFGLRANPTGDVPAHSTELARPAHSAEIPPVPIPEYVVYSALFHYLVAVKEQADELERSGIDAASLRYSHRNGANLSDEQNQILHEIASACVREVAQQDMRAQKLIEKYKAQFPGGKVPKGEKLRPPPPELSQMQEERNAMILRAKERLHVAFGDLDFENYIDFLRREFTPTIRPMPLKH